MSRTKLSTRDAITKVLTDNGKPMGVPEIIKAAVPMTALKGKTPGQTVYSILYAENKKADGQFVKVGKGTFKINPKAKAPKAKAAKPKTTRKAVGTKPAAKSAPLEALEQAVARGVEEHGAIVEQPVKRGRTAAKTEQLRAAYLIAFDNFATDRTEVAAALGVSKATASKLLNELATMGLVDSYDVNQEAQGDSRKGAFKELTWQANETYDSVNREQAERTIDEALA